MSRRGTEWFSAYITNPFIFVEPIADIVRRHRESSSWAISKDIKI